MRNDKMAYSKQLLEKQWITAGQFEQIETYRSRNIFSVRTELRTLLYVSVLLFTTGVGMLIYQHIDTIGHVAVLLLVAAVSILCFYFAFKKHTGFQRKEIGFANPVYDYLVLAAVLLFCVFVGYLQFQYNTFGTHYGLATLVPMLVSFAAAYYFDNKSVLSIGITGLAAYVGLSITPQALLSSEFYSYNQLTYIGVLLGMLLVVWTLYATKTGLKKHFNFVYLTFALHLISLGLLRNLFEDRGLWYILPLALSSFYFFRQSYKNASITLLVFTVLYAYIGFTVFAVRFIDEAGILSDVFEGLLMVSPIYFIVLIVFFVKLIKNFNKKQADDRI